MIQGICRQAALASTLEEQGLDRQMASLAAKRVLVSSESRREACDTLSGSCQQRVKGGGRHQREEEEEE
jgi:hypothetical protein